MPSTRQRPRRTRRTTPAILSVRTNVQHVLDVQRGLQRRKLDQAPQPNPAVQEWLSQAGPDGQPQTERPPAGLWNTLGSDERAAVDRQLKANAHGEAADAGQYGHFVLIPSPNSMGPAPRHRLSGPQPNSLRIRRPTRRSKTGQIMPSRLSAIRRMTVRMADRRRPAALAGGPRPLGQDQDSLQEIWTRRRGARGHFRRRFCRQTPAADRRTGKAEGRRRRT